MEKPLHIPETKKQLRLGLTVYCYKCNTNVSEKCKMTDKALPKCPFGNKHVFKVYVQVPGLNNVRKTKKLETRDVNEAIKQAIEFQKEVKENYLKETTSAQSIKEVIPHAQNVPSLLVHSIAKYVAWLQNEGVPFQFQRDRSEEHINDIKRSFKVLVECLRKNKYDLNSLRIDQVDDHVVGVIYKHLEKEKKFSNRTFNKYFTHYTSLLKWYKEQFNIPVKNCFLKLHKEDVEGDHAIIYKEEFQKLLNVISHKNGVIKYNSVDKPEYNIYRYWEPNLFKLFAFTGGRREEVIQLKWSNLIEKNGASYFKIENFKVNKIRNRKTQKEKKYVTFPITAELLNLLNELGLQQKKGLNEYIITPEITENRTKMMSEIASRAFSHFYSQIGSNRKLSLGSLRKTYITRLAILLKGNVHLITGHASNSVPDEYYINKEEIIKVSEEFSLFNEEPSRQEELQQLRNKSTEKIKTIDNEQSRIETLEV